VPRSDFATSFLCLKIMTTDFQKILVGVDLSQGDWLASDPTSTSSHFACDRAIEVAKVTGARLHYLATLNLDERTKRLLETSNPQEDNVVTKARDAMVAIVQSAASAGVRATYDVVLGRTRTELAEAARSGGYDLMMLGTRQLGALKSFLMGSITLELLRTSPCPVWVVKPSDMPGPRRILVATDFSPVCYELFDRAAQIASLFGAKLDVVHVVATHRSHFLKFSSLSSEAQQQEQQERVAQSRESLDELLLRPSAKGLASPPTLHLLEGSPSQIVREQVDALDIDLLALGTVGKPGVSGMVIGTTAQNILPSLSCSLLTMRPEHLG